MHIASFSSGLSSAIATDRVLERYGKENTIVVFEDTKFEDLDNYRFMDDCKKRWGIDIVVLTEGRNPYEVAREEGIIPNSRVAPCTFKLKINPFREWLDSKDPNRIATIYIGYDFTEIDRCERTEKAYNELGWKVDFPLLWKPYINISYSKFVKEEWGIEPPLMYALNYTHANCGGRCVKQGKGDWLRTLKYFPARYKEIEDWEQWMRSQPKCSKYAIFKVVKNGKVIPITLKKLREEYENKQDCMPDVFDVDSPCVVCGIGAIDLS